jgi:hypothetical protein
MSVSPYVFFFLLYISAKNPTETTTSTMSKIMNETINVSAVSAIIKAEIIDQGIISKPSALYSTIKLVKGLSDIMSNLLGDDESDSEPKTKKRRVGRPKKTDQQSASPGSGKNFRELVNEMRAKIETTTSFKLANFYISEGSLMYTHQVLLSKTNDYNVGRMYAASDDGVPPLIQLPGIVRNVCMSNKRSALSWGPTVVEIDQKTCHLTIMHWLMLQAGKDPMSVAWMREIIVNSDEVRRDIADFYLEDSNAVYARDLLERMTTAAGVKLVTPQTVAKFMANKTKTLRPCPVKTAKRMINGILYGQGMDAVLTDNCVIFKSGTTHHPTLIRLRDAVLELPTLMPGIDNLLEERFNVSWVGCHLAGKAGEDQRPPGQLALLCQTIESAITMRAMESCRMQGLTPVLYAYDGFYVELPKGMGMSILSQRTAALASETLQAFSIAMAFDMKNLDPLVIGTGALQRPEKFRFEREMHDVCQLRMETDADFDPDFLQGAYDIMALSGYGDTKASTSKQAMDSLAVYASKFYLHNAGTAGMYTRVRWDPVITGDIINTYAIGKNSLGELAHAKFTDALGVERSWLEVLESRLPYQCTFTILASSAGYNIKPLKRVFGEKAHATTDFTFSLRRECKILRDNFGKPLEYPQSGDSDVDLLILLHLEFTLCGYDTGAFVFLHRLIATRLARLHEKIPIIVQCSSATQGIGKNTFFEKLVGRLLLGDVRNKFELNGENDDEPVLAYVVSQSSMVGGRFNGFEAGLNLIVYDECARISDKSTQNQFKAKTTSDIISIEKKYQEVTQTVNMALSVFLSNYPVSLAVEPGCRRNFLIRVCDFAPRQTLEQTMRLHKTIENPATRWAFYRHLMTCNAIPQDLNELQRDIPLTDHKVAMMATADELTTGIVAVLATHPVCEKLKKSMVFSKRVIMEALKVSNPNNHAGWDSISTRLVSAMVGPMQRHDKVFDMAPDANRPIQFRDLALMTPPGRLHGMDFGPALAAHSAGLASAQVSRAPGNVQEARARFIDEALPALAGMFTMNLSKLQELARTMPLF